MVMENYAPLIVTYWGLAFATWVVMLESGKLNDWPFPAHLAVWLFWPLFAIKYLAIGASRVLQYGYLLLTGK
jgi:hypothetical protein